MVVEAAGEHSGGIGDLADGGGVVALCGEDLGGGVEEFTTPFGEAVTCGFFWDVGLFVGTRPFSAYACWLLTDTVSPVMYDE